MKAIEKKEEKGETQPGNEPSADDDDDEDDDHPMGANGLYTAFLMSILFISASMLEAPTETAYKFHKSVIAPFETTYSASVYPRRKIDGDNRTYNEIRTLDHMVSFIVNVTIPKCFNNEISATNLTGGAKETINRAHFINGYNYLVGMRFTLKKAQLAPNKDAFSKAVLPIVRQEIYTTPDASYSSEYKEPLGRYTYTEKNSYNEKGGYVTYLPGNMTILEAIAEFESMRKAKWFETLTTISFTIEMLYYNANYESALYIIMPFLLENSGTVARSRRVYAFWPQGFDESHSKTILTIYYLLEALFQLLMYVDLIKLLYHFISQIIKLVSRQKCYVPTTDLITSIVLIFCLTSEGYWYDKIEGLKYLTF